VTLASIVEALGSRSFGALILLGGTILASPIAVIPSVPTAAGVLIVIICMQVLLRRDHLWLPALLLRRSIAQDRMCRALRWLRKPAHWIDRVLRPRLRLLSGRPARMVIAATCLLIALALPVMELVPFSAHVAGLALTGFGLSLTARDGLLALFGFGVTGTMLAVIGMQIM